MATLKQGYNGSNTTLTISPASTATSATFVAGRQGVEQDNTSNLYIDAIVRGFITVGTTPTINTFIYIYVWAANTAASSTNIDTINGTDATITFTSAGVRDSFIKLAAFCVVDATTSNIKYPFGPFSVASLFGGQMPKFWGVVVAHNTGVNLNATGGNHEINYVGVLPTIA